MSLDCVIVLLAWLDVTGHTSSTVLFFVMVILFSTEGLYCIFSFFSFLSEFMAVGEVDRLAVESGVVIFCCRFGSRDHFQDGHFGSGGN